jgi:Uncharacterized protein conserved in bacteria (DUF2066)
MIKWCLRASYHIFVKFIGVIGLAGMVFSFSPIMAQEQDNRFYIVQDIAVDVQAKTASLAREDAFLKAQNLAFSRLFQQLTPPDTAPITPDKTALDAMVASVEVAGEKRSSVRYLARFTVKFFPSAVANFFETHKLALPPPPAPAVLLLPVLSLADKPLLWSDISENEWLSHWQAQSLPIAMSPAPLTLPYGELADITDITPQQALDGDVLALTRIGARYQRPNIIVAKLFVSAPTLSNEAEFKVQMLYHNATQDRLSQLIEVPQAADIGARFRLAQELILSNLAPLLSPPALTTFLPPSSAPSSNRDLSAQNTQPQQTSSQPALNLIVAFEVKALAELLRAERLLKGAGIMDSRVVEVSEDQVQFAISYLGDYAALDANLTQQGLQIIAPNPEQENIYFIKQP